VPVRPSWSSHVFRRMKGQEEWQSSPGSGRKGLVSVAFAVGLSLCAGIALAQAGEEEIKAAFLFNFARYVEWPASSFDGDETPVRVCLIGAGGFAKTVSESVSGKRVDRRSVEVMEAEDPASAVDCHILFVGEGVGAARSKLIAKLAKAPVLTVSDSEGFARAGGIANFYRADKKVRFEINPGAARDAGLRISSQLLRLARVVE